MRNLRILLLIVIAFMTVTCQRDLLNQVSEADRDFQLREAREFFENRRANLVTRGAMLTSDKDNLIVPHEYTPVWGKAEYSENDDYFVYEIPLRTDRPLVASQIDINTHNFDRFNALIEQKVLIIQDRLTKRIAIYIVSTIPDKISSINRFRFKYIDQDDAYSGVVLFSSVQGELMHIWRMRNGEYVYSVDMSSSSPLTEGQKRDVRLSELAGINIFRTETTRGGDEYEYIYCSKCHDKGCEDCIIYVTPERCGKCGEFLYKCSCAQNSSGGNESENDDDDEVDENNEYSSNEDFPPTPPTQGGYSPPAASTTKYYDKIFTSVISSNVDIDLGFKEMLSEVDDLLGGDFARRFNENIKSPLTIFPYSKASIDAQNLIYQSALMNCVFSPNVTKDNISKVTIYFRDELPVMLSAFGLQLVILHEIYHIYDALKYGYGNDMNFHAHNHMIIHSSDYETWLKELLGCSDQEAEILKYAGTESTIPVNDSTLIYINEKIYNENYK